MLELEDIYKSFPHRGKVIEVLQGVTLRVGPGDSIALIGASGVGKSTLLHVMGSLEGPTRGSVRFGNRNIYDMNESELSSFRNKEIGFVFQFHHLLPEFNAMENTMIPALIARYDKSEAAEFASEVLSKVGLGHRLTHRVGELSGGEQQRVAIARALVMKPKLILADEPTGNLDWSTGEEIVNLLLHLNKEEDVSMVIATHNLRLAKKMTKQLELTGGLLVERENGLQ
ncbi:ABC transporter ATP-binding protein [Thermodesulfobacteriota bacterium]